MKHTLIAIACTLALAGGNALAAQDRSNSTTDRGASGETMGQKARDEMHTMGNKARHMARKGHNKVSKARNRHERAAEADEDSRAMGAAGSSDDRQKRMDQAYEDYKSGRGATQTR